MVWVAAGGACDSYEALFTAFCALFSEDKTLQNFLTSLSAAAATLSQAQRKADLRAQLSFHLEDAKTQAAKPLQTFSAADIPDGAVIQVHLNPHATAPPVAGSEEQQPKKRRYSVTKRIGGEGSSPSDDSRLVHLRSIDSKTPLPRPLVCASQTCLQTSPKPKSCSSSLA
jgi:hypothetical protein